MPHSLLTAWTVLAAPWWEISTPLGSPVEPEVKMT